VELIHLPLCIIERKLLLGPENAQRLILNPLRKGFGCMVGLSDEEWSDIGWDDRSETSSDELIEAFLLILNPLRKGFGRMVVLSDQGWNLNSWCDRYGWSSDELIKFCFLVINPCLKGLVCMVVLSAQGWHDID
jgi:hypothetical protein